MTMNVRTTIALAGAAVLLAACGVAEGAPAAASLPPSPTSTPANKLPLSNDELKSKLTFPSARIHTGTMTCDWGGYAGKLTLTGVLGKIRAAALVTVAPGPAPRWNTSDGLRPTTQKEADAIVVASNGAVQPSIYTPWVLQVIDGPAISSRTPVNSPVTAFLHGGTLGPDTITDCGTASKLKLGGTYLVELGGEITDGSTAGPLRLPELVDALAYDPATHTVHTRWGDLVLT
jgi:hypothetical protein